MHAVFAKLAASRVVPRLSQSEAFYFSIYKEEIVGSVETKAVYRKLILGKKFMVYGTLENPLFLAKEVAEWIDNPNPSQMVRTVDDEEKLIYTIHISGQNRECLFLTEDGLYEVLMQSRKPMAKSFKKEVKKLLHDLRVGKQGSSFP